MITLLICFVALWTLYSLGVAVHTYFFSKDHKFCSHNYESAKAVFFLWMLIPIVYVVICIKIILIFIGLKDPD